MIYFLCDFYHIWVCDARVLWCICVKRCTVQPIPFQWKQKKLDSTQFATVIQMISNVSALGSPLHNRMGKEIVQTQICYMWISLFFQLFPFYFTKMVDVGLVPFVFEDFFHSWQLFKLKFITQMKLVLSRTNGRAKFFIFDIFVHSCQRPKKISICNMYSSFFLLCVRLNRQIL